MSDNHSETIDFYDHKLTVDLYQKTVHKDDCVQYLKRCVTLKWKSLWAVENL